MSAKCDCKRLSAPMSTHLIQPACEYYLTIIVFHCIAIGFRHRSHINHIIKLFRSPIIFGVRFLSQSFSLFRLSHTCMLMLKSYLESFSFIVKTIWACFDFYSINRIYVHEFFRLSRTQYLLLIRNTYITRDIGKDWLMHYVWISMGNNHHRELILATTHVCVRCVCFVQKNRCHKVSKWVCVSLDRFGTVHENI